MNLLPVTSDCIKQPQTYCKIAYGSIGSIAKAVMQFSSKKYAENAHAIQATKYIITQSSKFLIPLGIGMVITYVLLDKCVDHEKVVKEVEKKAINPCYSFNMDLLTKLPGVNFKIIKYTTAERQIASSWTKEIEDPITIRCPENLHLPEGISMLTIDAEKLADRGQLTDILAQELTVDHLKLLNVTENDLKNSKCLLNIKNLEIHGAISEQTLLRIHNSYPNIVTFVLPNCEAPPVLKANRLVKDSKDSNFEEKFKDANCFWKAVADNLAKRQIERQTNHWNVHFPDDSLYPKYDGKDIVAAMYFTHLPLFKKSLIAHSLKHFAEKQPKFLPFLRVLNLSGCNNLEPSSLRYITSLKLYELNLNECPNLYSEKSQDKTRLTTALALCIANGTQRIHLKNIENINKLSEDLVVLTEHSQSVKIEISKNDRKIKTLFRGRALRQPPATRAS